MDDLISRQQAIDALGESIYYEPNMDGKMKGFDLNDWKWHIANVLSALPSAETHDKRTETHACDCISRQSAIDALMELVEARHEWKSDASGEINGLNAAYCAIEDLPSVPQNLQPTCNQLATDCISRRDAITLPVIPKEHRKYQTMNLDDAYEQGWEDLQKCIENLPSAQPEIIRCKDCKYMTEHYDTDGNAPYWTCSEWDSGTDYDGFCHYAERREEMTREEAIRILKNFSLCGVYHQLIRMNDTDSEAISMAIKALEQPEPCEDAVSREAVYAVIEEVLYETTKGADNWYGLLNDGVRTLPSVTPKPEQRWIPCSELPSDNREVEVTCEVRRCDGKRYRYTCHASYVHKYTIESTDYCDWEEADEYNEDEDKYYALPGWYERVHNWDDYSFIAIADFVTAWCELPEPYRGGREG